LLRRASRSRSRSFRPAHLYLRRLGRQIRRPGSQSAGRNIAIAMNEPIGAIGILAPSAAPLLGLLSLVLPAIAVATLSSPCLRALPAHHRRSVPNSRYSDLPGGVVNLVAGHPAELAKTLAEHDASRHLVLPQQRRSGNGARCLHRQHEAGVDQRRPRVRLVQLRAG